MKNPLKDKLIRRMAAICVVGFGGFMVWASIAPLEEGVASSGQIIVEENRQVVQHLEGGLVREIFVREGDIAQQGEVLVVLEKTRALANRGQIIHEYAASAASVARLAALRDDHAKPDFSRLDGLELGSVEKQNIIRRESDLFKQQKNALRSDIAVLETQIRAAEKTIESRNRQVEITNTALQSANSELELLQEIFAKQLARKDQVTSAERLVANLEGEKARLESEGETANSTTIELRARIVQTRSDFARDIASDHLEANAVLLSAEEQLRTAQDVLNRSEIIAPVSGEVLNMAFSTVGGVVRPGETLMEIVPDIDRVTASIRIAAVDRSAVHEGQTVRTQFSSYKGWQAPRLEGVITDISADLKMDQVTGVSYYEARVHVSPEEMARTNNLEITPGMPVDVFIYSGKSRTFMEYIFEPLGESLFRGLRNS